MSRRLRDVVDRLEGSRVDPQVAVGHWSMSQVFQGWQAVVDHLPVFQVVEHLQAQHLQAGWQQAERLQAEHLQAEGHHPLLVHSQLLCPLRPSGASTCQI